MINIMLRALEPYLNALRGRRLRFDGSQSLFHRGDPVKNIHVVLAGSVHLVRHQGDGSALILQRAGEGAVLAEASLYSDTYHCDAVAFGAVDTIAYTKAGIKTLLAKDPAFAEVWASHLAHELQGARLRSEILSLKTVAERLRVWMAWHGGGLPNKGQWKLVAGEIGVSPEALYRELGRRRDRKRLPGRTK